MKILFLHVFVAWRVAYQFMETALLVILANIFRKITNKQISWVAAFLKFSGTLQAVVQPMLQKEVSRVMGRFIQILIGHWVDEANLQFYLAAFSSINSDTS